MNTRFRRVVGAVREGWKAAAPPRPPEPVDRLTMRPEDVEIHRGGGVEIQRPPGVRRDADSR